MGVGLAKLLRMESKEMHNKYWSGPDWHGSDVVALPPNFNLLSMDAVFTGRVHSQFLIHFCICSVMAS